MQNRIGDVISVSFGEAEQCIASNLPQQEHSLFSTATSEAITLVAAAGDSNVTGVGGTNLIANLDTGAFVLSFQVPKRHRFRIESRSSRCHLQR